MEQIWTATLLWKMSCSEIVRAFDACINVFDLCQLQRQVLRVSSDALGTCDRFQDMVSFLGSRSFLGPPSFAPALGVFSHLRSRAHQLFVRCSPSGLTRLGASSLGFPEASLSPWPSPRLGSPRRVCPTGSSSSSPDARDRAGVSFVGVSRSPLITPRAGAYCWNRFGRRLSFGK